MFSSLTLHVVVVSVVDTKPRFCFALIRYDSTQPAQRRVRRPWQRWWRWLQAFGQWPGPKHQVPRDAWGRRWRLGGRDVTQTSRLVSQARRKSQLLVEDQTMSKTTSDSRRPRLLAKKIKATTTSLVPPPKIYMVCPCICVCACVYVCVCVCVYGIYPKRFFSVYVKIKNKFKKR